MHHFVTKCSVKVQGSGNVIICRHYIAFLSGFFDSYTFIFLALGNVSMGLLQITRSFKGSMVNVEY